MERTKLPIEAIAAKTSRRGIGRWIGAALAVLAIAAGGYWYLRSAGTATPGSVYLTQPAKRADILVTVTATGTVEPTNEVSISSELSGTISAVEVDHNDIVKVGQPLARLDTVKLEAAIEHARATLAARQARVAELQATLEEANQNYQRAVQLEDRGISSRQSFVAAKAGYDRAVAALDSAKADVRVAEADVKLDESNLKKACICSPINGIVLSRSVEVGQIVASSLQAPVLFSIAEDLTKMELLVDIDEADIGKVRVGNAASFTVEAYQDRTFPAVISQIRYAPQTVEGVVTYKAVLAIDNADLLLRPGMTATAEIRVAEVKAALVAPNAALRFRPPATTTARTGGSGLLGLIIPRPPSSAPSTETQASENGKRTIYVLRSAVAVPVPVRTGQSDGLVTEILDGDLKEGDAIITDLATP